MKSIFATALAFLVLVACTNNDEGSNTVENKNPGNPDSATTGTNHNNVDNYDANFLAEAAYGGMKEVHAGNVARKQGQAKEVKDLATMMVEDHTAMNVKVKALAAQKNVQLPDSLTTSDMEAIHENKKTGSAFDKEYTAQMVSDHEATIRKFEDAANNAKDPDVKALVNEALPKLRHHLEASRSAKQKVGG